MLFERGSRLAGAARCWRLIVTREEWRDSAENIAAAGGRLVSMWASREITGGDVVHAAFAANAGLLQIDLPLSSGAYYPGLEGLFPAAERMQRAIWDLSGLRTTGADTRPWLRHTAWPETFHPLSDPHAPPPGPATLENYPFVRVEGDGVHEIAVGPVHAGTIEPGHFRFSVVGEKVLKLEERLGFTHKGIERRFAELPLSEGHRLAARICGDSAVAFSWAYCQAYEGLCDASIPPQAAWLRALALEYERISNHLGDLGSLGNDAGFAFGLAQFTRLKEQLLRVGAEAFAERYLMSYIVPGGVRFEPSSASLQLIGRTVESIAAEVEALRTIYDEHAGLRDRFVGAGVVDPQLATRLGLIGLAGRASGRAYDLRVDQPCEPYNGLAPKKIVYDEGDVAARVAIRFDEIKESARLVRILLKHMPQTAQRIDLPTPPAGASGVGFIEGWRGPVFIALQAGADGVVHRCHPHDPSWQNWPVLEHAIIGDIVPDFPLINKSFNLSYSGHDL
ncbi:MAG: hypothetical protein RBS02_12705 [Steroidobacteraceae bacterium]|nr:hypothetical protein [Steroidobacteraceae bacterium]